MNDEALSTIKEKFLDEVSKNKELRTIAKRISAGKADFSDTARYNDIASDILGSVFSEYVPELNSQGLKEYICTELLRSQYADINDILAQVQTSLDEKKGIKIAPQKADFPLDRVKKIAHSLEDTTVPTETIQRRAGASCANVSKSFHDDYMKKNASFRNDAGLKCYILRETDGNCCKWCSALAGRYEYDVFEMPDDIFCRHDNCGCTVTFEHGRTRQNVWSKRSWEVPDTPKNATQSTVISPEKAEKLQEQNLPKTLTNGDNGGIIKERKTIFYENDFKTFDNGNEVNEFFYYDSEERGLKARKNSEHGQWKNSLSKEQIADIGKYSTDGYADINDYWRKYGDWKTIDADKVLSQTHSLDKAIADYDLKESIKVYRAVQPEAFEQYWNDMQRIVGTEYTDPAFMSTSPTMKSTAMNQECIMELFIPAGKGRGAYINDLSAFQDEEYEFLLARNSKFNVISVKETEENIILKMEMIIDE